MAIETILSEEEKQILQTAFVDPPFFCWFFLQKWFPVAGPEEIPWVHRGIMAILTRQCDFLMKYGDLDKIVKNFVYFLPNDFEKKNPIQIFHLDETGQIHMSISRATLIMMPRGMAKTTVANAMNIRDILYQVLKFLLYTSESGPHAERQITNIARQLTTNKKIVHFFGNLKPDQRNDSRLRWSESDGIIQTVTGITLVAKGRGAQIRGQLEDGVRPDRLIFDDVEDKDSVRTAEQRQKTKEWLYGDLLPTVSELNAEATVFGLGTLLSSEALLEQISKSDPEFTVVRFGILDADGDPIWPKYMSKAKLEKRKQRYAMLGLLHVFYLEYFNEIRNPENAKFLREYFIYTPRSRKEFVGVTLAVDPAISDAKDADYFALAVVGALPNGQIHVIDTFAERGVLPDRQVDLIFEYSKRYAVDSNRHGIESNGYQKALALSVRSAMFRKKHFFDVTPIPHGNAKIERVEGILQYRYKNGYITHQHPFALYETLLLDWPNGKKDLPDVVAMAVKLLGDLAGLELPEESSGKDSFAEDEYAPLSEVFGGDWRKY